MLGNSEPDRVLSVRQYIYVKTDTNSIFLEDGVKQLILTRLATSN